VSSNGSSSESGPHGQEEEGEEIFSATASKGKETEGAPRHDEKCVLGMQSVQSG